MVDIKVDDPTIPSVGQPCNVLFWYPTTLIKCNCREGNQLQLLMVVGFQNPTRCPQCGTLYSAVQVVQKDAAGNTGAVNEAGLMVLDVRVVAKGGGMVQLLWTTLKP